MSNNKSTTRVPVTLVSLELDRCALSYGVLPCEAIGTLDQACYNTFITCQDQPNYTKTLDQIQYQFCTKNANLELAKDFGLRDVFPAIESIETAPTQLIIGKGLASRNSITVNFNDFVDPDHFSDPYFRSRNYT